MSSPHAEALDRAASLVDRAHELARAAALSLPEAPQRAKESATAAGKDTGEALKILLEAGARLPDRRGAKTRPEPNPLAEMARVEKSRPEALALLEALRAALPHAEALDLARGDVLDTPVLGSRGLVWGEELVQSIARLELELYGPSERVTGGKE